MTEKNIDLMHVEDILDRLSLEDRLTFKFNVAFSEMLIQQRTKRGWTQDILAKESGVNRVTISRLERFQHTPSLEVILKLLYALNMTIRFAEKD